MYMYTNIINMNGRLQSRNYNKNEETYTTYEVSIDSYKTLDVACGI